MRTVHKYPILSWMEESFTTYQGFVPRHAGIDGEGQLCVWLEVDTSKLPVEAEVKVVATGREIDFPVIGWGNIFLDPTYENKFEFVGTAIESNGYVWHVYIR